MLHLEKRFVSVSLTNGDSRSMHFRLLFLVQSRGLEGRSAAAWYEGPKHGAERYGASGKGWKEAAA
jgi:hypothetical protein